MIAEELSKVAKSTSKVDLCASINCKHTQILFPTDLIARQLINVAFPL